MNFTQSIKEIEEKIAYTFRNKALLKQAFTRSSYCNERKRTGKAVYQSNEVLEFFGDSILSAAIVTLIMRKMSRTYEHGISTELGEGDFSNIKAKLSDKKSLSQALYATGLQKYLLLGEGDIKLGVENEPSVMEDLFESIIGAIYIDSEQNLGIVINTVAKLIDVNEYLNQRTPPMQSFKNALQEWCADKNHRHPAPVYKTVSESGPDHKKVYERACYIGEKIYGTGTGKNFKIADTAAAEVALNEIMLEDKETVSSQKFDVLHELRRLASKHKKTSPEFRDLGETKSSTPKCKEYLIECRFSGFSAVGTGESKHDAKVSAATNLLNELDSKKKTKKTASFKPKDNSTKARK